MQLTFEKSLYSVYCPVSLMLGAVGIGQPNDNRGG